MHGVLEPGSMAIVSTWAAERPLGLLGPMCDTLREAGISAPYARAFDADSYVLGVSELHDLLTGAGFRDVSVDTVELACVWETSGDVLATISGTPFGPAVASLASSGQAAVRAVLRKGLVVRARAR